MVQANELRVGNIVNVNYSEGGIKHCVLTADLLGDLLIGDNFNINIEDCFPIEINPEILEQCGFTKAVASESLEDGLMDIWVIYPDTPSVMYILQLEDGFYLAENYDSNIQKQYNRRFNYLHQLQNLIFALTGKELEINLPTTA